MGCEWGWFVRGCVGVCCLKGCVFVVVRYGLSGPCLLSFVDCIFVVWGYMLL